MAIRRRRVIHRAIAVSAGRRLRDLVPRCLRLVRGDVVAGYWPMGDEVDVRPLLLRLHGRGCVVALPVVTGAGRPLVFRVWRPGMRLEAGSHGTRHPGPRAARVVPDVVLVPLLAFDRMGGRLGYGAGYYDRTLARLRTLRREAVSAVGVAYAGQRVTRVPMGRFDQPLDRIVTERGLIKPGRTAR
ncbi:MAG: 5-formyltetrahydrofolate cyclo-ligase [Alphaproteobacteria bacterium]